MSTNADSPGMGKIIEFTPAPIPEAADPESAGDGATTAMVVDAQPVFREVVRALLERDGDFSVVAEAGDGGDAVSMVEDVKSDVVVMDIQMAHIGGIEATRRILASNPRASVVLISMTAETEYPHLVREIGVLTFIAKRNLNALSLRSVLGIGPSPALMAA